MNGASLPADRKLPPKARNAIRPLTVIGIVFIVLGALVPIWTENAPFLLILASHAAIAAIIAVSLDLLTGNTGLVSFGHAAWFGLGTYVAGLIAQSYTTEMLLILPLTVLLGALLAWFVGQIFIRQVGTAFAILTLAFSQVLYALVYLSSGYTGGEDGLQGIPIATVFGQSLSGRSTWYWVLYGCLVAIICLALYVRRSPLGRAWLGIRENTERSFFIGLDVRRLKLLSYVISASLAMLAGGLFVLFNGATSPETLSWFESGKILMYVVMGGVGTIVGPAIGAVVFTAAESYISSYTEAWLIYFGALFIVIVVLAPGGIFGLLSKSWARLESRSTRGK